MLSTGRRALWWVRVASRKAVLPKEPHGRITWWRIGKVKGSARDFYPSFTPLVLQSVCVGAVVLPVGLHLASQVSFPRLLPPTMAGCTSQPTVTEVVARADELYEANKMREGLSYLKQYEYLDKVEVTLYEHANVILSNFNCLTFHSS